MKKYVASAFCAAFFTCGNFLTAQEALAQAPPWVPLANAMFVLLPQKSDIKIYLAASIDTRTKDVAINLLDLTGNFCKEDGSSDLHDATPIRVNGQFLQFAELCINGTSVKQPKTEAGKQFLNSAVWKGEPVVIETGTAPPLHYPGTKLAPIKEKLEEAAAAL